MNNVTAFWGLLFIGLSIGFSFGVVVIDSKWETASIEHGCGQYNPTTAEFEWINKNGNSELKN